MDGNSPAVFFLFALLCCKGPASAQVPMLEKMIETGMNIARLNFSHGSYEYHGATIRSVREAVSNLSERSGMTVPVAIALDTKGPEIRTGLLEGVTDLGLWSPWFLAGPNLLLSFRVPLLRLN